MKRRIVITLTIVLVAVAGTLSYRYHQRTQATLPQTVEERQQVTPSAEIVNVEASINYLKEEIRREPAVVRNYVELAQAYLQQAEGTGDEFTYLPQAREMLEAALRRDPNNYHALTLKATLLNKLHQFEQSRDLSRQLLAQYPEHAYVHGTLVDALVELGAYEEAVQAADRMLSIRPGLDSYARASYLRELHGDTEGAIAAMRLAADAGMGGHQDRAWALYQLGQLFLGDAKLDTAAYIFNGILEERPQYTRAVHGLAQVEMARGAYPGAIQILEQAYPEEPSWEALELLAEAYAAHGNTRKAQQTVKQIQKRFLQAEEMGEVVNMEYADFLADNDMAPVEALRRARIDQQRRPHHLHSLETHAWTLYKNGRADEAIPYIERAMRLENGDAMVHYRAAMIYKAAGHRAHAADHFRAAIEGKLHIESGLAATDARQQLSSLAAAGLVVAPHATTPVVQAQAQ